MPFHTVDLERDKVSEAHRQATQRLAMPAAIRSQAHYPHLCLPESR
jgi:hypothetical protein